MSEIEVRVKMRWKHNHLSATGGYNFGYVVKLGNRWNAVADCWAEPFDTKAEAKAAVEAAAVKALGGANE